MDALDQPGLRPGVFRDGGAFLDEMNLDIQVFHGHGIPEVPVEPVRLFDKQSAAGPVALEPRHHLAEPGSSGGLRRLHILECVDDLESVPVGILAK
jgi:hypothetical protein